MRLLAWFEKSYFKPSPSQAGYLVPSQVRCHSFPFRLPFTFTSQGVSSFFRQSWAESTKDPAVAPWLLQQPAPRGWEVSHAQYAVLSPSRKGAVINSTITAFLNRPNTRGSWAIGKYIPAAREPFPKGSQIKEHNQSQSKASSSEKNYFIKQTAKS